MTDIKLGIDIGGTNIKFAVVNEDKIIRSCKIKTAITRENIVSDIVAKYNELKTEFNIVSVGAGVAGGVSNDILDTTNLPFTGYNLKAELVKYMEGFTEVENDANCAAIAETKYGNVSDCKNLVLMTLGTGVGGGVVLDGNIYRGYTGCGGEIGHMIVQAVGGRKCPCGQTGCLEQYASASALVKSAKIACMENPDSFLYKQYIKKEEQFSGEDIFIALENECNVAKKVFNEYLCYLAAGVDSVVNAFNPEAVVLAGGITVQGEKLLNPLKEKLCSKIRIEISELQGDAGALGATML